jgi:hypothetical protein
MYGGKQIKSKRMYIYRQKNAKLSHDEKMCSFSHYKTDSFHLPVSETYTYFEICRVSPQVIISLYLSIHPIFSS